MGRLMLFLIGAMTGAALFHVYYLSLAPAARCGWDHPFDSERRTVCRNDNPPAYPAKARHQLDDLVGNVAR